MAKISREKFKVYEGVFDNFTLNTLEVLKRKKYFDSLGKPIKTGKEGDVYLAEKWIEVRGERLEVGGEKSKIEKEFRAIKMFRMTSANFKKITQYINRDFRFKNIKGNLRKVILVWAEKEFRNLLIAHKANISVPFPFKQQNNIIIMEYIAGGMLKDIPLENPREFFDKLIFQLKLLRYNAKLIHGDLSEFNIMVQNQQPILIDFGQAMSVKNEDDFKSFYDLYERDIFNIVKYFNKRYNMDLKLEEVFLRLEERD